MLELKDIVKTYPVGAGEVHALRGVSVAFRNSEFVAVLGQSGCGKTTMLNIIGGLDRYTSGDLLINGQSTKAYSDADWDAYRNHSIGFVFQSYNLIPHQSVLANVEMALELSGAPKAEQRRRAVEALERVGLGDQLDKRPAMMSGGQMQRVAIARAIVNNPDIILADEPTGALDSKTSVQIMDLLQEIAQDRLVIMVTHNPELADRYATRIVRLSDGQIQDDTHPLTAQEMADIEPQPKPRHTHLSFLAALGLSANNLRTKKGRAFLTAFAGAIGIIGIALILSLSSGMNDYINKLETDVMGSYPIEIDRQSMNMSATMERSMERNSGAGGLPTKDDEGPAPSKIVSENLVGETYRSLNSMLVENNLGAFRSYIEAHRAQIDPYVTDVAYSYDVSPEVYRTGADGAPVLVSPRSLIQADGGYASMSLSMTSGISTDWKQLVDNQALREDHFALEAGQWPQKADEVALVVDDKGRISDFYLYTLGLMDIERMQKIVDASEKGEEVDDPEQSFAFDDALGREFTVFSPSQLYERDGDIYVNKSDDDAYLKDKLASGAGQKVRIVGVLRAKESASYTQGVVYTGALTKELMATAAETPVVKAQLASKDVDVLTGKEFGEGGDAMGNVDAYMQESMAGMFKMADKPAPGARDARLHAAGVARPGEASLIAGRAPLRPWAATLADDPGEGGGATGGEPGDPGAGAGGESGDPAAPGGEPAPDEPAEKPFTVAFVNWNGEPLGDPVAYAEGATVTTVPEKLPTHAGDGSETYVFIGWTSSADGQVYTSSLLPKVTQNVTYRATFVAVPADLNADQVQAVIAALAKMTPEQKELVAKLVKGGEVTLDDLIGAGVISQDQIDRLMGAAQDQIKELAQQYVQDYLDNIDTEALLKQYLGSLDTDALIKQYLSGMDMKALVEQYLAGMDPSELAALFGAGVDTGQLEELMAQLGAGGPSTYDSVLRSLGYATEDEPYAITFYPKDFEAKQKVQDFIADYNAQASKDDKVTYTDLVGLMTRSITEIIDIITAILVAFVSISLVVSSIMIAIITWISVLERTKEIGIMRALGASKGDITRIFNAETFIEGLLSGVMGVAVTLALNVPISGYIYANYGAPNIATLPWYDALLLVAVSVVLTFIAGFIPARLAAKKDPVEALRSE